MPDQGAREGVAGVAVGEHRQEGGAARAGVPGREIGARILSRVSQSVGIGRSARHLGRDAIVTVEGDRVRVAVPSHFIAEYVGRNFVPALRQAAAAEMGRPGEAEAAPALEIVVEPGAFTPAPGREGSRGSARDGAAPARAEAAAAAVRARRAAGLRDVRRRLEDFVVGECNRIAYTAACAIADGTAPARFSPMFLHGACGVGKTHLLQGMAGRAAARLGGRVRYTTAEDFTNEFVQALRTNSTEAFRRGFRDIDLLCIDDIHFLSSKVATQAEFLHVLNTLGLGGRMVVLASDEAPREIRSMSEALTSRFLSGAVIRIEPPDDATRVELVRRLSASRGMALDEESVALISERAGRPLPGGTLPSVREIEGMLTRVEAMHSILGPSDPAGGPLIGRSLAARALGLATPDGRGVRRPVASSLIIERVCRALRVDPSDLMGRGRHARVVLGRALVTYLARRLTTMSYPEIARSMARPNHSTVITAFNRVTAQIAEGKPVEGGPDLAGVTIRALAERLEREITAAAS